MIRLRPPPKWGCVRVGTWCLKLGHTNFIVSNETCTQIWVKHKQIYPYLRYGILSSGEKTVPGRVFTHNEGLDFFASVAELDEPDLKAFLVSLLSAEIASSKCLEDIAFGKVKTRLFRTEVQVNSHALRKLNT